jgi:hypothetical protein
MTIRNTQPSWPMDATTLPQPRVGAQLMWAIRKALGAFGCVAAAFGGELVLQKGGLAQAWNAHPMLLVCVLLGAMPGCLFLGLALIGVLANRPIWHAAATVLSDVPSEPAASDEFPYQMSGRTLYAWTPLQGAWRLAPKADELRSARRFSVPLIVIAFGSLIAFFWFAADLPLFARLLISAILMLGAVTICAIFWFPPDRCRPLPSIVLNPQKRMCEIGPVPAVAVAFDSIVAVQMCAYRRKARAAVGDGIEVNLVVLADRREKSTGHECYRRIPLMNIYAPIWMKTPLAVELAERLGVPLLCHATQEHWRTERSAAKLRPAPARPTLRAFTYLRSMSHLARDGQS